MICPEAPIGTELVTLERVENDEVLSYIFLQIIYLHNIP